MARTGTLVDVPTAEAFEPLLGPARYKGARGGRGSAKSRFFSGNGVRESLYIPGYRMVCIREVQRTLEQSVKRLIEDRIKELDVQDKFEIKQSQIATESGGLFIFQGMQDHTADSIKSLEGFDRAWVEEAQSLSQRSLDLLRPTLRKENSELWFSWNPDQPTDPVDKFFCGPDAPPDSVLVNVSWRDNPWFPKVLRTEMEWDRRVDFEKYEHIWEGAYEKHSEARVFKNWRVEDFVTPADAVFLWGGDWGYAVDPTVAVRMWVDEPAGGRKRLNIDQEAYAIGVEIDYIPDFFDKMVCGCAPLKTGEPLVPFERARELCANPRLHGQMREWTSVADSARPETIAYLQRHGYPRMEAAIKGPNSVKEGVIFLQGFDIRIHPRCPHVKNEFQHYSHVVDKQTGIVTPMLEDKKNHVIDSTRYAVEKLRRMSSRLVW